MTATTAAADDDQPPPFAEWAIVELLGHRRTAGLVQEVRIAGAGFLPAPHPVRAARSVYALHPVTEATARRAAVVLGRNSEPVNRWELEAAPVRDARPEPDHDDDGGPF